MCDQFCQDSNDCHQILSRRMQTDGLKTKSGPQMYFIWSTLFFFSIELVANIESQENPHKTLFVCFFPLEKQKRKIARVRLQSQMVAAVGWCGSPHSHHCLCSCHRPSTVYFHSGTENSFNLPSLIPQHCVVSYSLSASYMSFIHLGPVCAHSPKRSHQWCCYLSIRLAESD